MKKYKNSSLQDVVYCLHNIYKRMTDNKNILGVFLNVSKLNSSDNITFTLTYIYDKLNDDIEKYLPDPYWADYLENSKFSVFYTGYPIDKLNISKRDDIQILYDLLNAHIVYDPEGKISEIRNILKDDNVRNKIFEGETSECTYFNINKKDFMIEENFEQIFSSDLEDGLNNILDKVINNLKLKKVFGIYSMSYKDIDKKDIIELVVTSPIGAYQDLNNTFFRLVTKNMIYHIVVKVQSPNYYIYDDKFDGNNISYIKSAIDMLSAQILYDEDGSLNEFQNKMQELYPNKITPFDREHNYSNIINQHPPVKLIRKREENE